MSRRRSAARFASLGAGQGSKHRFHPSLGVSQKDVLTAEEKTRRLLRFVLVLLIGFGLFTIWSEAVPRLQILKRVQIWPSIALLEAAGSPASQAAATRGAKAEDSGEGGAESGQSAAAATPFLPTAPSDTGDNPEADQLDALRLQTAPGDSASSLLRDQRGTGQESAVGCRPAAP